MAKKVKQEKEKSSGKGKTIIIIVLLLIIIAGGAFGGFYIFFLSKNNTTQNVETTSYIITNEVMVNLTSENNKPAYLKTGITISYDVNNKKLAKEIESKKIELQDTSIWYLKGKVATDFEAGKEQELKSGLISELNKVLTEGKVIDVFYSTGETSTNFLVQSK